MASHPAVGLGRAQASNPDRHWASAWRDLRAGWSRRDLWWVLAVQEIKGSYRRSFLGPFWITVQMAAFAIGIGLVYSALFGQPLDTYLPYVAAGFLLWGFMAGAVIEATRAYTNAETYIRSVALPLSLWSFRSIALQCFVFLHNAVVLIILLFAFRVTPSVTAIWLVPLALALLVVNGLAVTLWLGPMAARFRDVSPLVQSVMQIMLFITPVFWVTTAMVGRAAVIWNPFAYFLELFRAPLLGEPVHPSVLPVLLILTVVNVVVGLVVFARSRVKLAYWVG